MLLKVIAAFLIAGIATAPASVVTYSDRAVFNAAAGPLTLIEFGGALPPGQNIVTLPSFTSNGVTFQGETLSGPGVYVIAPNYYYLYNRDGFASIATFRRGTPADMTITLPAGTRAVGFDFFSVTEGIDSANDTVHFSVGGSTYDVLSRVYNGLHDGSDLVFFGFISSNPISSFVITSGNTHGNANVNLEHFDFGGGPTSNVVPEPTSGLLVAAAVAGIALYRRRRTAL